MKNAIALLLLTAAAAFCQVPKVSAVIVPAFTDCPSSFLETVASSCLFDRVQITVDDPNAIVGVLVALTYKDSTGLDRTLTAVILSRSSDGKFRASFPVAPVEFKASALELLAGQIGFSQ